MQVFMGVIVTGLALLCWGGQVVSWMAPAAATRLGLTESEDDVEPIYWADIRGEALWDSLTLWTLLVAGVLLILDISSWAYVGLGGGGMYIYFAGRGILTRRAMQSGRLRIGSAKNVRIGYVFLSIWGVMGLAIAIAAVAKLETS